MLALPAAVGTAADKVGNADLNKRGPQSVRPLPRWYWRNLANPTKGWLEPSRWRKFDSDGTADNDALESISKTTGLKPGPVKLKKAFTVVKWDDVNLRGTFTWKDGKVRGFERLSQREAAAVQVDNFVYDFSGSNPYLNYLQGFPHMVEAFRSMMRHEVDYAKTHVFFYHSYGATSIINDVGACLMRVAFPDDYASNPLTANAILPRTDRSAFNNRSVRRVVKNWAEWFWIDGKTEWKDLGMSSVLSCIKPDSEATVVKYFKGNYDVGTNLNPPFDEMLGRLGIASLKKRLLQRTLEEDVDVGPYFAGSRVFVRKSSSDDWSPVSEWRSNNILSAFSAFLNDDSQLGPVTEKVAAMIIKLSRTAPGAQARGSRVDTDDGDKKWKLLVNTPNTGHYLQLAVPHEVVATLAFANVLTPAYGTPDPDLKRALDKVRTREKTVDGQARIVARPDLFWGADVRQWVFQFSRGAAKGRKKYLRAMEKEIRDFLGPAGLLRAQRLLRSDALAPIVVRSHNVNWENTEMDALVEFLSSAATGYDFCCLQETTSAMLKALAAALPASHALLSKRPCGSKTAWAALVYRKARFELVGAPWFGCFKLKSGELDGGRPVVAAVFRDTWLNGRATVVASCHAPHGSKKDKWYLQPNLAHFVAAAISQSGAPGLTPSHAIFAGDFNRDDWDKERTLATGVKLYSAQGLLAGPKLTINKYAYDNLLFASFAFKYTLELTEFQRHAKRGSDHHAVEARFVA